MTTGTRPCGLISEAWDFVVDYVDKIISDIAQENR